MNPAGNYKANSKRQEVLKLLRQLPGYYKAGICQHKVNHLPVAMYGSYKNAEYKV